MGAYLYYMLADKKKAAEFNETMADSEIGKKLIEAHSFCGVNDETTIEWAEKECPQLKSYYQEHLGQGDFKASGISEEEVKTSGCETLSEYFELITDFFVLAQKKYKMWFASRSCAFNLDESYFSIEQMKRITNNGKRLKHSTSDPEKYLKLKELLK